MSDVKTRTVCPADLFFEATADTALETAARFNEMLLDPKMPEEMRREIRDYFSDLVRAFPDQLLADEA